MDGTMLWFNPAKRHGFIQTDEGERLRVDWDAFAEGHVLAARCRGTRVAFDRCDEIVAEPRALNVAVVPLVETQRARLRRRSG